MNDMPPVQVERLRGTVEAETAAHVVGGRRKSPNLVPANGEQRRNLVVSVRRAAVTKAKRTR